MQVLSPYFTRNTLDNLGLTPSIRDHLDKLLALAGDDNKINVQRIHETLFSLNTTASANAALSRLINTVNKAAEKHGIEFKMNITTSKQGGAPKRWVWFEGPVPTPPVNADELRAIPEGLIITGQRGIPENNLPVVILLTFNKHETKAVIRQFHGNANPPVETRNQRDYTLLGSHGGMQIVHRVSAQGEGEAQSAAHHAIADWQPRAIIGVGIAFGVNPERQRIGDVLIAGSVKGYDLKRVNQNGAITPRGPNPPASAILLDRFRSIDHRINADEQASPAWPRLKFGTILSGDTLVDNLDYRDSLVTLADEAIGGEMEGLGIHHATSRTNVDWIIVKAICDWGDGNKNNASKKHDQQLAAENAALVVHRALSTPGLYPLPGNSPESSPHPVQPPAPCHQGLRDRSHIPAKCFIDDIAALETGMEKDLDKPISREPEGVDVLEYLQAWIKQENAPPLFALLGEYGMGKTVLCQRLAELLEEQRRQGKPAPRPLYFDLRLITGLDKHVPTLQQTLEECMTRGWLSTSGETYTLQHIHHWIEQGAVIILDGLDEALVKLTKADGQIFTANLLKLLADARTRRREGQRNHPPLKLLISCRTQYFRTLRDQQTHFTGQERGEHKADSYKALVLLPLSETQILHYLAAALPGSNPHTLLNTLKAVHNLEELAHRPYTLQLLSKYIPEIEKKRMQGKTVYGVTLYRNMTRRWLERDDGKHHISPRHKMRLAAHLAAYLWQRGQGFLPAGRIEDWLHTWLDSRPELRARYRNLHPEQLEEDLRTATFLSRRDDEQGSSFHFAHTSLMEFFLADHLFQALADNKPKLWKMAPPSRETIDFLGQMLAEADEEQQENCLQTLARILAHYRQGASETGFHYLLHAHTTGYPCKQPEQIDLAHANLQEWRIGSEQAARLDLTSTRFTGANLTEAVLYNVDISGADFSKAKAGLAELHQVEAKECNWQEADLSSSLWRLCTITGGRWQQSDLQQSRLIRCTLAQVNWPKETMQSLRCADCNFLPALPPELTLPGEKTAVPDAFYGHLSAVTACAFSSDDTRIVSASHDNTLRIWDAHNGECIRTLKGHSDIVWACAYSSDDAHIVSASGDQTLRIWDPENGACIRILNEHSQEVTACAFSSDDACIVSASKDNTLRIWDPENGKCIRTLKGHAGGVFACAFSSDDALIVSASGDKTLRIWDAENGACIRILKGHSRTVTACAFSNDNTRILSASWDKTLRIWDVVSGECIGTLKGHLDGVWACAFSSDDTRILSASYDKTLRLWNVDSGSSIRTLNGHTITVSDCAFSSDDTRILSASYDNTLRLWDTSSGNCIRTMEGNAIWINACAFSNDNTRILSASWDKTLWLWDAQTGNCIRTMKGHTSWVTACGFSSDDTRIISASNDKTLRLWDAQTGNCIRTMKGHSRTVTACMFSSDDTRILTASVDKTLRLWNAKNGECIRTMKGHKGMVYACAFSSDDTRILSASDDKTLRLWNVKNGECIGTMKGHTSWVTACGFSSDDTRILSASNDKTLRLWKAKTGECIRTMQGHASRVFACVFSSDNTRILSASRDNTLRIWDAQTGNCIRKLKGHSSQVLACTFSSDNARIVSASWDNTLRLWDAATGRLLRTHHYLPEGNYGVIDEIRGKFTRASKDGWRWLGYNDLDPATNTIRRWPAEIYGPLPG